MQFYLMVLFFTQEKIIGILVFVMTVMFDFAFLVSCGWYIYYCYGTPLPILCLGNSVMIHDCVTVCYEWEFFFLCKGLRDGPMHWKQRAYVWNQYKVSCVNLGPASS